MCLAKRASAACQGGQKRAYGRRDLPEPTFRGVGASCPPEREARAKPALRAMPAMPAPGGHSSLSVSYDVTSPPRHGGVAPPCRGQGRMSDPKGSEGRAEAGGGVEIKRCRNRVIIV
jgi:hypothetical protein